MAKTICKVSKFGSHQVMVKLGKKGRYKTPEYKAYEWEMRNDIMKLPRMVQEQPVQVKLTFNTKGGVQPEIWRVINKANDKTYRKCSSLEMAEHLAKEKHYIKYYPPQIKYGVNGDWDNLAKPVLDFLEAMRRIPNDRFVSLAEVEYTYNNPENTIEIEINALESYMDENNIFRFRRR